MLNAALLFGSLFDVCFITKTTSSIYLETPLGLGLGFR